MVGVGVLAGNDDRGVGRTGGSSGAETRQCLGLEVVDLLQEVQVQVVGAMEVTWQEEEVRNQEYREKMKDLLEKKEVIMKETMVVVKVRII